MKEIGTVGYVTNSHYTAAMGTMSSGRIYEKVKNKFVVEVMFITSSKVILQIVDGLKEIQHTEEVLQNKAMYEVEYYIARLPQ